MEQQNRRSLRTALIGLLSITFAVLIWQIVAGFIVKQPFILPSFTDVADAFYQLFTDAIFDEGTLFMDIGTSLLHFGIGLGAAMAVGIPIGMGMGWFREADRALNPIIEIIRPIPPLAWVPFALIWFGLTHIAAGFVVFIGAFFPILINTYTGFKGVPKIFVEAANVLGCTTSRRLIRYIAFPSSIPSIAAGIRIGMGVGWMSLVAAEIFGAGGRFGLGRNLWQNYSLHQMDNVVVYMLILGLIGLIIDAIFRWYVNTRLLKWLAAEVR